MIFSFVAHRIRCSSSAICSILQLNQGIILIVVIIFLFLYDDFFVFAFFLF